MAGYKDFSMSNNAIQAYQSGEKPLSKWTKADILKKATGYIRENDLKLSIELLGKISAKVLKSELLKKSSWHHTSKFYNETNFYSLDEDLMNVLTDSKLKELIDLSSQKPVEEEVETWECEYLVWGGSRKHPTATVKRSIGEVKGGWLYLPNGTKKSVTANGFKFIRKI